MTSKSTSPARPASPLDNGVPTRAKRHVAQLPSAVSLPSPPMMGDLYAGIERFQAINKQLTDRNASLQRDVDSRDSIIAH